jgi:hypothetical protein
VVGAGKGVVRGTLGRDCERHYQQSQREDGADSSNLLKRRQSNESIA